MKPKAVLHFNSTINHNNQIYCGFELMKRAGLIDLEYRYALRSLFVNFTLVEIDGLRVIFDIQDNCRIDEKVYGSCDVMVKRMLLASDLERYPNLVPFGLNYPVFAPNAFMRRVFLKNRKLLLFSLRYHRILAGLLNINESLYNCDYRKFGKAKNDSGKITFSTRLWNPENGDENWKQQERRFMNNERIELVRLLSREFGDRFSGGIQKDALSDRLCPDLVLDKKTTDKRHYLRSLPSYAIGICNKGLEDSIGWKFAEYLSDSLAIVSNPIDHYVHHGDLRKDVHFLEYSSTEECLAQVRRLAADDALRKSIAANNKAYYQAYLHPLAKFREIFRLLGVALPETQV